MRRPFERYTHEDPVMCTMMLDQFSGLQLLEEGLDTVGRNAENVAWVRETQGREICQVIQEIADLIAGNWSQKPKLGEAARYIQRNQTALERSYDDHSTPHTTCSHGRVCDVAVDRRSFARVLIGVNHCIQNRPWPARERFGRSSLALLEQPKMLCRRCAQPVAQLEVVEGCVRGPGVGGNVMLGGAGLLQLYITSTESNMRERLGVGRLQPDEVHETLEKSELNATVVVSMFDDPQSGDTYVGGRVIDCVPRYDFAIRPPSRLALIQRLMPSSIQSSPWLTILALLQLIVFAGCMPAPSPWEGPKLRQPRDQLTVDQLLAEAQPPLLDTSFLARPAWAGDALETFAGAMTLESTALAMNYPATRELHSGEDRFPKVTIEWVTHEGLLLPRRRGLIRTDATSQWDLLVGVGAVWHEAGDGSWNRASFPIDLVDRYFNQVRNCVASFIYRAEHVSNVYLQCGQETADRHDEQIGDLRAMIPASHVADSPSSFEDVIVDHTKTRARRLPTRALDTWDKDGDLAKVFDERVTTNASTSAAAVFADGMLYVHSAQTRHGRHPYSSEMHHGVFSVTKSLAAAVAMFYLAQRYGEQVFDELLIDHIPGLTERSEWQGVTLSHALNMATGTHGGEASHELYEALVLAETQDSAIANIAALGDAPEAPGEAFNYATTNTFLLSLAMQHLVETREGKHSRYWALVQRDVLEPIGAEPFDLLLTRDQESTKIPYLGFGGRPTLDQAAKIAVLIANEGEHEGRQLLHRGKVREALGRGSWDGYVELPRFLRHRCLAVRLVYAVRGIRGYVRVPTAASIQTRRARAGMLYPDDRAATSWRGRTRRF